MIRDELSSGLALVRLLQLASPALPIGGYSYSQGLEWVIAAGEIRDAATAKTWIGDVLECVIARGEAPVVWRLLQHARQSDWARFAEWTRWFFASRETTELRAESAQMGAALYKLALELGLIDAAAHAQLAFAEPWTLPAAYALAARGFAIEPAPALTAYLWSWLENQVLAAMKAVPLGQLAGQRLLKDLGGRIPHVVAAAKTLLDEDIASFAPGQALASSRHETQYTRLFRS